MLVCIGRNGQAKRLCNFRPLNNTITHNTYDRRYTIKMSYAIDILEKDEMCGCLTR